VKEPASRRTGCGHPTVCGGIVSPAAVQIVEVTGATPHDHFTTRPDS
jgi:hypothetical protein